MSTVCTDVECGCNKLCKVIEADTVCKPVILVVQVAGWRFSVPDFHCVGNLHYSFDACVLRTVLELLLSAFALSVTAGCRFFLLRPQGYLHLVSVFFAYIDLS